ncbi:MNNG and nitrosoguanidine resistance protein [Nemania sp. FL0916]|nr:MNNG and nitrosoguanidine resistance protein [Nemania sp. FL0916]
MTVRSLDMQGRANTPLDVSRLLIAGRANGSEKTTVGGPRPTRYRRPSYQSSRSQGSHGSQGQCGVSNQNIVNPHDYDSVNEYKQQDYDRVLNERQYEQPHQGVGFWHPTMKKLRGHVFKSWIRTIVILTAFLFAALSLHFGVFYNVNNHLRFLEVHIVDFDSQVPPYDNVTALVGPVLTNLTRQIHSSSIQQPLGYRIVPPSEYNFDPNAVRRGVYNWDAWAAIVVNPNATTMLLDAVTKGNASYDPTGAVQYIIQTARQETTTYNYILPQLEILLSQFSSQFGSMWTKMLLTNNSFSPMVLAEAPAAVNPAIVPLKIDLRPFDSWVATPALTIGLIYLIIVAFFSTSFLSPIHNKYVQLQGRPPLRFWQLIIWRWLATVTLYLFVSLTYSLVSLAFGVPLWGDPGSATEVITNATSYGRGSFIVYWIVHFIGMMALGLACENAIMVLGPRWMALWLIFWITTNVSTAFYSLELAPAFYGWGRAWPLHHVVQASRQIIFDLKSELRLNLGVLIAWTVINTALFPLCDFCMRWRIEHERRKELESRDQNIVRATEGEHELLSKEGEMQAKTRKGLMSAI